MRSINEILSLVCGFLNRERIDYVVVGGIAVIFYGNPRTTMDADILLRIEENKIKKFVEFLKKNNFFASEEDLRNAIIEKSHCTFEDKKSMLRLDLKGIYNEVDKRTFEHRVSFNYSGTTLYLASPEDTIANKLAFGSEQDIKDAEGIYVRQMKKLDMRYLEKICRDTGVYVEFLEMKKRVKKYLRELKK